MKRLGIGSMIGLMISVSTNPNPFNAEDAEIAELLLPAIGLAMVSHGSRGGAHHPPHATSRTTFL
jgi:hypothetical protein